MGKPFLTRRRVALSIFLFLGITLVAHFRNQAPTYKHNANPDRETRGVWMTHVGNALLYFSATQDEAMYQLASLHFNRIYPAVWDSGHTLYPSAVAQKVTGTSSLPVIAWTRRDVLKSAIAQAHRQELSVVPWFEYGLMVPANSELARRHPDWLSHNRKGKRQLNQFKESPKEISAALIPETLSTFVRARSKFGELPTPYIGVATFVVTLSIAK